MDGHYAPNLPMGAPFVRSLRRVTGLPLELVMTVDPGFGNQPFLNTTLPKIRHVGQMIEQLKPGCELEVDGGIDEATAPLAVAAGANVLVAGSAIFAAGIGVCGAMQRLRGAINCGAQVPHCSGGL